MEPMIGEIVMFAGNFAPRGFVFCNGQLLNISEYTTLFAVLGTVYGGDGRTTFGVPDLRGRVPIHAGRGNGLSQYRLGEMSGIEMNRIDVSQMPAHNHTLQGSIQVSSSPGTSNEPGGKYLAKGEKKESRTEIKEYPIYSENHDTTLASDAVSGQTSMTGGGQYINNMQPYLCVNFIIATEGTYPSRN